jgi:threonine synthase
MCRACGPFLQAEIAAMAGLPYAQLAAQRVMQPFVGDCLSQSACWS